MLSNTVILIFHFLPVVSVTLLYKGYLDDPRNTDNAWVEAEVWNFHYIEDNFPNNQVFIILLYS